MTKQDDPSFFSHNVNSKKLMRDRTHYGSDSSDANIYNLIMIWTILQHISGLRNICSILLTLSSVFNVIIL